MNKTLILCLLSASSAMADQTHVVINNGAVNPVIKLSEAKLSKKGVLWGSVLGYKVVNTESRTKSHGQGGQVNLGGYIKVGDVSTLGLAVTMIPQNLKSSTTSDKTNTHMATVTFARMLSDAFSVWGTGSLGKITERFDFLALNNPARTNGMVYGASLGTSYVTKIGQTFVQPFLALRYNGSNANGYMVESINQYVGHEKLFATKLEIGTSVSHPICDKWHVYFQPRYQYTLDKDPRTIVYDKSTVVAELGIKYGNVKAYYLFQRNPSKTLIHGVGIGLTKAF